MGGLGLDCNIRANRGVPEFESPLRKITIAITFIKGPRVDGWAKDIATWVDTLDPINDNIDYNYQLFVDNFNKQFMDSTKQQRAQMSIERIKFLFPNIDQYLSNFKLLAREANYTIRNNKTYNVTAKMATQLR